MLYRWGKEFAGKDASAPSVMITGVISLDASQALPQPPFRQGPWNVDLRTPPGPEGSNGSLLDICRGHPGTFSIYDFGFTIDDLKLLLDERNLSRKLSLNLNRKWRIKS